MTFLKTFCFILLVCFCGVLYVSECVSFFFLIVHFVFVCFVELGRWGGRENLGGFVLTSFRNPYEFSYDSKMT